MSSGPRMSTYLGLFSSTTPNCVGDPYQDPVDSSRHTAKGQPGFVTGKGIPDKYHRLYEGEKYKNPSDMYAARRMEGKRRFLTPNGFRPSSGRIHPQPVKHIPERLEESQRKRKPVHETMPRQIYTSPSRKGCGGAVYTPTPKLCFTDIEYVPSEYDAFKKKEAAMHKERQSKIPVPFTVSRVNSTRGLLPDSFSISPVSRPQSASLSRPQSKTSVHTVPVFRPSSATPASHHPIYVPDPYDERRIRAAVNPNRTLPHSLQQNKMCDDLINRRPWSPTGGQKTMVTTSIALSRKSLLSRKLWS